MGLFYNKSSHPLPITLLSGGSMTIPPRTKFELHGSDESSSALLVYIEKGMAVRLPDRLSEKLGLSKPPTPLEVPVLPLVSESLPVSNSPVVLPLQPVVVPQPVEEVVVTAEIVSEEKPTEPDAPQPKTEDPSVAKPSESTRRDRRK